MAGGPDALERLAALQGALPSLVEQAVEQAMQRGAAIARQTHAFHNITGRLRASIAGGIVEATGTHVQGAVSAGAEDADPAKGGDYLNPSREYAPHIELGTARRPPRPFIHTAFVQAVTAERVLQDALEDGMRQVLS